MFKILITTNLKKKIAKNIKLYFLPVFENSPALVLELICHNSLTLYHEENYLLILPNDKILFKRIEMYVLV